MNYIIPFAIIIIAVAVAALPWIKKFRHVFYVTEGFAGLVYQHGLYVRRNNPGRHVIWGQGWTMKLVDLRKATLQIPSQDVLTADSVGLKLSLLVSYQVADPVKAVNGTQNWITDLYHAAQLALRAVANGIAIEALLGQRLEIGAQLLARIQPEAARLGIAVIAVEVRDVVLPADLKRAFADVLKAKQEGQAALERARGESAALRNLANAARVLEGNPALMNLRLLQSLAAAQNAGNTLVVGLPGAFVPLKQPAKSTSTEPNEAT